MSDDRESSALRDDAAAMTRNQPSKAKSRKGKSASVGRGSRVQSAYQQLRELIVHGRLAPGSRIIEADLSHRLGVSRTPVRDALRWLQQEGFVAGNSQSGVKSRLVVAPLTKEDARELYWIVGRIEGLAARSAAELGPAARAALAKRLRALSTHLREMARTGGRDPNRVFELDRSFHRNIVEASAGPRLLALHDAIQPQAERYWRLYASAILDQLATSASEHARIIRAIAAGDGDAAEHGVEVNWRNGAQRLGKVIDTLGERGSW